MSYHKSLSKGDWRKLNLIEQMANIGSEVGRTINWNKRSEDDAEISFKRASELFNLTITDPKNKGKLKELTRTREIFNDWFVGENVYNTTGDDLNKYFMSFAVAARKNT